MYVEDMKQKHTPHKGAHKTFTTVSINGKVPWRVSVRDERVVCTEGV